MHTIRYTCYTYLHVYTLLYVLLYYYISESLQERMNSENFVLQ